MSGDTDLYVKVLLKISVGLPAIMLFSLVPPALVINEFHVPSDSFLAIAIGMSLGMPTVALLGALLLKWLDRS